MSKLRPPKPALLEADKAFHGAAGSPFTVGEFWQWAFSDLKENSTRGLVAEFLVARALGDRALVRQNWADFDVTTPAGVKVEVKASAYLQSWDQERISKIQFSGLAGRALGPNGTYAGEPSHRADVYVFCVQIAQEHANYDPFALAQWDFWVLPRTGLPDPRQGSIGLGPLSRLPGIVKTDFTGLAEAVNGAAPAGGTP